MKSAAVIGGGIVGAHIALYFSEKGYEVFLIEKNEKLGLETSSRNSGVLHAGIYYKKDSLKAELCVKGNILSREFFNKYGVEHVLTGKYIIARDSSEEEELDHLYKTASQNGVEKIERVAGKKVKEAVNFIKCSGALYSGTTAIIDVCDYLSVLKGLLYQRNVHLIFNCSVGAISRQGMVYSDRGEIEADVIVNAAGLYSDEIAQSSGLNGYKIIPLKGDYYITTSIKLNIPVYPVPDHGNHTLGVHLTPTMGKEVLIGPSEISSSGKDNYIVETKKSVFERALEAMIDGISPEELKIFEGYSGNRPRAYYNDNRCDDFIIEKRDSVINLLGIESPGLTSAPAIAQYVYDLL